MAGYKYVKDFIEKFRKKEKEIFPKLFDLLKKDLITAIKKDDSGIYAFTGDNTEWHFNSGYLRSLEESEWDYWAEQLSRSGEMDDEKIGEILQDIFSDMDLTFDNFMDKYGEEVKDFLIDIVEKSKSIEELLRNVSREENIEVIDEILGDFFYDEFQKSAKEYAKKTGIDIYKFS